MNRFKGLALGTALAAALVAGGLLVASQVFAATGTAKIGSNSVGVGDEGVVDLEALDVTAPGLGAWTIDIIYDPSVITAVDCSATNGGVCNAEFADDQVRITGATAEGLEGDSTLGTITFACGDEPGESPLEVSLFTFADATLGGPVTIDSTTEDGTFACTVPEPTATAGPQLPQTGTGPGSSSDDGMTWIIVALAGISLAAMAGYGALRLRTTRA